MTKPAKSRHPNQEPRQSHKAKAPVNDRPKTNGKPEALQRALANKGAVGHKTVRHLQTAVGNQKTHAFLQETQPESKPLERENKTGIPGPVLNKMESHFGEDFSQVKVHKDSAAAPQAGALAYTSGNDIHFAPGQLKPETQNGQALLGHELTHVVQQRQGRVPVTGTLANGLAVNDNPALEAEADREGKAAAQAKIEHKTENLTKHSTGTQRTHPVQRKVPWEGLWNPKTEEVLGAYGKDKPYKGVRTFNKEFRKEKFPKLMGGTKNEELGDYIVTTGDGQVLPRSGLNIDHITGFHEIDKYLHKSEEAEGKSNDPQYVTKDAVKLIDGTWVWTAFAGANYYHDIDNLQYLSTSANTAKHDTGTVETIDVNAVDKNLREKLQTIEGKTKVLWKKTIKKSIEGAQGLDGPIHDIGIAIDTAAQTIDGSDTKTAKKPKTK